MNSLFRRLLEYYSGSVFRRPEKAQERTLISILRANQETEYGKMFGFSGISNAREYQERVPVITYDDIAGDIERIKTGDQGILTKEPVAYLATTSGTTDKPKYIPVTDQRYPDFMFENIIWFVNALRHTRKILGGKILYFSGPRSDGTTEGGIPFGAISGYIVSKQNERLKKKLACSDRVLDSQTFEDKMRAYYEEAVPQDVRQIAFAYPIELQLFKKFAAEMQGAERINLKDIWPNLALIGCYKKGLEDYPLELDDVMFMDHGVRASEGTISIGCNPANRDGIPAIQQTFLEFRESGTDRRPLLVQELDMGKEYEVIMTTPYGLYRYDIGDMVRVTGMKKKLPLIEFVGRNKTLDVAGEHCPYSQIEKAVSEAQRLSGVDLVEYTVVPNQEDLPFYELIIESPSDDEKIKSFLSGFEDGLRKNVLSYDRMRSAFGRLGHPRIAVVPQGTYERINRERVMNESQPKAKHVNDKAFRDSVKIENIRQLR